jgi:integrase
MPRRKKEPHRVERCIFYDPGRSKCFRVFIDRAGKRRSEGFASLEAARAFRDREERSIIDSGRFTTETLLKDKTVSEVISDFLDVLYELQAKADGDALSYIFTGEQMSPAREQELSEKRTNYRTDIGVLQRFLNNEHICNMRAITFTRGHVKEYIKERLETSWRGPTGTWKETKTPAVSTIRREIGVFARAFELLRDYHPNYVNPFRGIDAIDGRQHTRETRRLEVGELETLIDKCKRCARMNDVYLPLGIFLAVETGMRQSEVLRLRWEDVDFVKETITIRKSKTDEKPKMPGRIIPLTIGVEYALGELQNKLGLWNKAEFTGETIMGRVFGKLTKEAFNCSWRNVRSWTELTKPLTFHDLRHEAVSRFDKILTKSEVRLMIGHAPGDTTGLHPVRLTPA